MPHVIEHHAMAVLSTAHISKSTADWLEAGDTPMSVWSCEYGFMMHVWTKDTPSYAEMPPDLQAVMSFVKGYNCSYVLLDRDGEKYEGLNLFDW